MFRTIPETREQIIARNVNAINDAASRLFAIYRDGYTNLYWMLWNNPQCTPTEILEALGTDAIALFIASAKASAHLKDINPDFTPPETDWTFVINPDGSVTPTAPVPPVLPEPIPPV